MCPRCYEKISEVFITVFNDTCNPEADYRMIPRKTFMPVTQLIIHWISVFKNVNFGKRSISHADVLAWEPRRGTVSRLAW